MNFKLFFLQIFTFVFLIVGLPKNLQKKLDKEIKSTYAIETFLLESIDVSEEINEQLPLLIGQETLFKITHNNTLIGYAFLGKAPSKTDEFDYLVLFDSELIVTKTKILIYREDYGGEIGSKRWLKQFIGSSNNTAFRLHDNIVAISGATISVNSMTDAMNQVLKSIGKLQELNIL